MLLSKNFFHCIGLFAPCFGFPSLASLSIGLFLLRDCLVFFVDLLNHIALLVRLKVKGVRKVCLHQFYLCGGEDASVAEVPLPSP